MNVFVRDTSFLVALLDETDFHHDRATKLFHSQTDSLTIIVSHYVIKETCTLLVYKYGITQASTVWSFLTE